MSELYFVPFFLSPLQSVMVTNFGFVWEQFYNDNFKAIMSLHIVESFPCSLLSVWSVNFVLMCIRGYLGFAVGLAERGTR
jgi:hypothetical protein